MESLYNGHIGTTKIVLAMEVSSIQELNNTVIYYCGTGTSVFNIEFTFIQRFVIKRFHCIKLVTSSWHLTMQISCVFCSFN